MDIVHLWNFRRIFHHFSRVGPKRHQFDVPKTSKNIQKPSTSASMYNDNAQSRKVSHLKKSMGETWSYWKWRHVTGKIWRFTMKLYEIMLLRRYLLFQSLRNMTCSGKKSVAPFLVTWWKWGSSTFNFFHQHVELTHTSESKGVYLSRTKSQ